MSDEDKGIRRKRRWWWAFGIFVVVAFAAAAGLKSISGGEYAFLNGFNPTHKIGPRVFPNMPPGGPQYRFEVYFYDRVAAPKVLEAMKRELSSAQGYTSSKEILGTKPIWNFVKGSPPLQLGAVYSEDDTVLAFILEDSDKAKIEPGGAIVAVMRGPTWFETKWEDLKKFLHVK